MQTVKTKMKCCVMRHFIRFFTVCHANIYLLRKNNLRPKNLFSGLSSFIVFHFMKSCIGLKRIYRDAQEPAEAELYRFYRSRIKWMCASVVKDFFFTNKIN